MTYAEEQRKIFWEVFEDVLKENGEPFKIAYIHQITKEITSYAAVNRFGSFNANAVDLSFLLREEKFRVNIYVSGARLMRKFLDSKEQINHMVTRKLLWEDGKMVIRPSVYFDFILGNKESYKTIAQESMQLITELINVANNFGKDEFFDF